MPTDRTSITVIVPAYNAESELGRCLDALAASSRLPDEILVVDDGSTDRTAEVARERGARVLATDRPTSGPAIARNLAAREAKGELLVFVDADVLVHADVIERFEKLFQAEPDVAAAFGSYDDAPAHPDFLSQYKNLQHHFVHQQGHRESSTFWAGCGAVRRTPFLDVGGYDGERYPRPSIEDIELGFRIRAAGHRIVLDREILSKHLKQWTFRSLVMTDVFCRAVPWTELILESEKMPSDLNLRPSERISALFTLAAVASLLAAPFFPWSLAVLAFSLAGVVLLNRSFYGFLLARRGLLFAAGAVPIHLLYYLYSSVTFAACQIRHRLGGGRSRRR